MRIPSLRRGRERRDEASLLENPSVDVVSALVGENDGTSVSSVPGIAVNPQRALRLTAVYAAVRVIAESCASLPIPIYTRSERSRDQLVDDPRWPLLNGTPNPEQTTFQLLSDWFGHALLWGRGYLYMLPTSADGPPELWPLRPDRTRPMRTPAGDLYFQTDLDDGERVPLPADRVIMLESIFGASPIRLSRNAIAIALAGEEYAGRFWANNARPGGVIEVDGRMDDDAYEEFRRRWRAGHEGLTRSQLVGILTGGAKWKDVGIAPQLAQFIETRQFGVREIARLFRVPPHMIGDLEGTVTRASIEQQSIEFVVYSLQPWLVRAEQALKQRLFDSEADRAKGVYPEFYVGGLMRGDTAARYAAYSLGIQWGFLSRADVRELENLPWVDGLDEYLVPLNMAASSALPRTTDEAAGRGSELLSLLMRNRDE